MKTQTLSYTQEELNQLRKTNARALSGITFNAKQLSMSPKISSEKRSEIRRIVQTAMFELRSSGMFPKA